MLFALWPRCMWLVLFSWLCLRCVCVGRGGCCSLCVSPLLQFLCLCWFPISCSSQLVFEVFIVVHCLALIRVRFLFTFVGVLHLARVDAYARLGFTEILTTDLCACASTHAHTPVIVKKHCVLIRNYVHLDYIEGTNFQ